MACSRQLGQAGAEACCRTGPPCPCALPLIPPCRPRSGQVLKANLELPRCILGNCPLDHAAAAAQLQHFTAKQQLR